MRLLEFNRDEGGANPIPARPRALPKTAKPSLKKPETTAAPSPARAATVKRSPKRTKAARQAKVFPLNSVTPSQARRKPIDLEQLQHRVGVLEKRIKARTEALGDEVAAKDLEKLKQRMQLLERNINSELWAAKQPRRWVMKWRQKTWKNSSNACNCWNATLTANCGPPNNVNTPCCKSWQNPP